MTAKHNEIGAIRYKDEMIELRPGRPRTVIRVHHRGDRPIQVGSHFHFFEVNKALVFDREQAFGMHLDILSGTAVRFEPGEEKEVQLVRYGGRGSLIGFNGLTMGDLNDEAVRVAAIRLAQRQGYMPQGGDKRQEGEGGG
ncbi:urease subunit beta [Paenibacillus darwinianus]|uniref:Urease subunit beta n=1 Tax=Paenibacillus darwinianus TaxID=1380763 RepID=A0A9W5S0C8_9BACL|nr:urease subunit beta [Paenibacillus darwinianus]EXX86294.1 urease subunit beta [Paenibacillus darwinianus]EXX86385.1 urease subunit beta [Paenibacillus darwinianus]EXX90994.1 urease subunit beta [Paenibacillus darwinianus]